MSAMLLAGCNQSALRPAGGDKYFLTTNFEEGKTFRYKFVSTRDIVVRYEDNKSKSKADKMSQQYREFLEMIVSYTPVKVDPYGDATIKAVCESVKASRSGERNRETEAIEFFEGKEFTFKVDPVGRITDDDQMRKLVKQAGKKPFIGGEKRIKTPDMIDDFIVTQWTLWNSINSVKNPLAGLRKGQSWDSQILLAGPMVMRKARKVTYTFDSVSSSNKGRVATIKSEFEPAESVSKHWTVPYKGSFQMKGTFGFLRAYKLESLTGEGTEIFNIDKGLVQTRTHNYTARFGASLLFPLGGSSPSVTIDQHYTMELL